MAAAASLATVVAGFVECQCSAVGISLGWELAMRLKHMLHTRAHVAACLYMGVKFEDVYYPTVQRLLEHAGLPFQSQHKQFLVELKLLDRGLGFCIPYKTRASYIFEFLRDEVDRSLLEQWVIYALISGVYGACGGGEWTTILRAALVHRTHMSPLLQVIAFCTWPRKEEFKYIGGEVRRVFRQARLTGCHRSKRSWSIY